MARLARLALAGHSHHVMQSGHNRQPIFVDDDDRQAYLAALREAAAMLRVPVHGHVLLPGAVHLIVTPPADDALSRLMQAVGRRYVAGFNRRHGRTGTLWEGRFRAAVIEAGVTELEVLTCIEQAPVRAGLVAHAADYRWSSAAHHTGRGRDGLVTEPAAYWALGNTPFEREARWARRLEDPLPTARVEQILESVRKGWGLGSGAFLAKLSAQTSRPLSPRPRGRPRGAATKLRQPGAPCTKEE